MVETLFNSYDNWSVKDFKTRRFTSESFHCLVDRIIMGNKTLFVRNKIGKSFEGRDIFLYKVGNGDIKILLWSQMHGDESTATMAIADIFGYFKKFGHEKEVTALLSKVTLLFVPMLNPDGAARHERRTAQGIDLNRDALALITPEAKILKNLQSEYKPQFGYNLHDQELSSISGKNEITAFAVLAPVIDHDKSENGVVARAKKLAAYFVETLEKYINGKIGRYKDSFEPRAFGDNMQKWGTSTVLLESGHIPGDEEKHFLRKLYAVTMISSFFEIASGNFNNTDVSRYDKLPFNSDKAFDLIIRNILIKHKNGTTTPADIAISFQIDTHTTGTPKLADAGDLHTFVGVKEIDGEKKLIEEDDILIETEFNLKKYFNFIL